MANINIAGIDIDERCLTDFNFDGNEPKYIITRSENGEENRVLMNYKYSYSLKLQGLFDYEKETLMRNLKNYWINSTKITLNISGTIKRGYFDFEGDKDYTDKEFDFLFEEIDLQQQNGYYDIVIPVCIYEYF